MCNDVSADSVMVLIMMPIGDGVGTYLYVQ
jgi:hypothetical protein